MVFHGDGFRVGARRSGKKISANYLGTRAIEQERKRNWKDKCSQRNFRKRVWGSKKWSKLHEQSASTPVKPSGVKTPDKSRTSIETQTESKESNTEESMEKRLTAAEEEISYILKDANKCGRTRLGTITNSLLCRERRQHCSTCLQDGLTSRTTALRKTETESSRGH